MKTVGLVLGSGGARGWAHIGVIRALEDAGVKINCLAGASIGAFVGSIYAAGELDDLEEFVRSLDWKAIVSFFDVVFPSCGLLDGNRIYELLSDHLQKMTIEQANIRFCCVATDLLNGEEVRLQSGPMIDAVRSSISMPGVFTPFQKDGKYWGDGGVVNPVPVDVMREMGVDVVIAVNLNHNSKPGVLVLDQPEAGSRDSNSGNSNSGNSDTQHSDAQNNLHVTSPENADRTQQQPASEQSSEEALADAASDTADSTDSADSKEGDRTESSDDSTTMKSRVLAALNRVQQQYETVQDQLQEKIDDWMPDEKQGMNIFDVIGASLSLMEQQVTQGKLNDCPPDILLEPNLSQYGIFDFHEADAMIQEGYRCMEQHMAELQKKLAE